MEAAAGVLELEGGEDEEVVVLEVSATERRMRYSIVCQLMSLRGSSSTASVSSVPARGRPSDAAKVARTPSRAPP